MKGWSLLGMLALVACQNKPDPGADTADLIDDTDDGDGDGYTAEDGDCNDSDASIYPGAVEICDGIDNNCDSAVDEGVTSTYYADTDADGFGDPDATVAGCDQPSGTVSVPNDCDDTDTDSHPGAAERCDGRDNDCDGAIDEDVQTTWYADADADGYGDPASSLPSCDPPTGYIDNNDDCDDLDEDAFPGGVEVCDEADNDCDGAVDEDVTTTFYRDVDGDSYGVSDATTESCDRPTGYAPEPGDCDDTDSTISPRAAEVCDDIDNDCDGDTDEDSATDAATWYADSDSDGYGDASDTDVACEQPGGYVDNPDDCDDSTAKASPALAEVCDDIDNDCDGDIDEASATDALTWYADSDSDGYGTAVTTVACDQPSGFAAATGDCNDSTAAANPGATEVCDSIDNDCDSAIDEGVTTTYYEDDDSDGYGDASDTIEACTVPSGYVTNDDDCNDATADANPGETEVCDSIDNDCDGSTDEGVTTTYYLDYDGDSYGDAARTTQACSLPSGYATSSTDCDDTDAASRPGGTEVCDSADNDCDGTVDEGVTRTFYADTDSDGYGSAGKTTTACTVPSGYVTNDDDCDDDDGDSNPAASEACDDVDNDCDGIVDNGVLGDGADCPAESCAEIIGDQPTAASGSYYLDPTASGSAGIYTCEMTTDGGGWTLIADWDRVSDGDSLSDLAVEYTALYNNMSRWTSASSYIEWADYNATGDALAYEAEVVVPNGGELMYDLYFYGYSMEQSGVWFFVESGGSDQNVQCKENLTTSAYSTTELSYRPGYTCSSSSATTWTWNYTKQQTSFSSEITAFHMHSMMYDTYGDYARLYRLGFWVR